MRRTVVLTCLMYVGLALGRPYTVSRFGDVTIENDGATFKCDQITCPPRTARCQVTKNKEDQNSNFITRRNVCYSSNGAILLEKTTQDAVQPGQTESLNVVVGENGSISQASVSSIGGTSYINGGQNINFDWEAFNKNLQESINSSLQNTLNTVRENLNRSLGGIWGAGGVDGNDDDNDGMFSSWRR